MVKGYDDPRMPTRWTQKRPLQKQSEISFWHGLSIIPVKCLKIHLETTENETNECNIDPLVTITNYESMKGTDQCYLQPDNGN